MPLSPIPNAPEADAKSKEEKRFARADKNEDGRISLAELVEPRRKAFAKLDVNAGRQAELRGMGGADDRQVRGRRRRQEQVADPGGICDHRAQAAQEAGM